MRFRWLKVEVSEREKMMRIDNETRLNVLEKMVKKISSILDISSSRIKMITDRSSIVGAYVAMTDDDATNFDE